jgi:hypothetical protein
MSNGVFIFVARHYFISGIQDHNSIPILLNQRMWNYSVEIFFEANEIAQTLTEKDLAVVDSRFDHFC